MAQSWLEMLKKFMYSTLDNSEKYKEGEIDCALWNLFWRITLKALTASECLYSCTSSSTPPVGALTECINNQLQRSQFSVYNGVTVTA